MPTGCGERDSSRPAVQTWVMPRSRRTSARFLLDSRAAARRAGVECGSWGGGRRLVAQFYRSRKWVTWPFTDSERTRWKCAHSGHSSSAWAPVAAAASVHKQAQLPTLPIARAPRTGDAPWSSKQPTHI